MDEYMIPVDVRNLECPTTVKAGIQLGATKVFLRRQTFDMLESLRLRNLGALVERIQNIWRMTKLRGRYIAMCKAALRLQAWTRMILAKKLKRILRAKRQKENVPCFCIIA
jgi:myosin heavy subunit